MAIKTTVQPIRDRLLVKKREKTEDKTEAGIILLADTSVKDSQLHEGTVVAAGDGKLLEDGRNVPLVVKVGDVILFGRYSGSELVIDGQKDLLLVREDEVVAIVTREGVPDEPTVVDPPQEELG